MIKYLLFISMISLISSVTVTYNIATIYQDPTDPNNIALAPLLKEFNSGNGVLENTFHNEENFYTFDDETTFPASTMLKYSYKYENRLYNHLEFSSDDTNRQEQIRKLSLVDGIIFIPQHFDSERYDHILNYLSYIVNKPQKIIVLLNYFDGIEDLEEILRNEYIEKFGIDCTLIASTHESEGKQVYTPQTLSSLLSMMNSFFYKNTKSFDNTLRLDLGEQHLLNGRGLLGSGIVRNGNLTVGDTVLGVLEGSSTARKTVVTQIFINNVSVASAKQDDYVSVLLRGTTYFYPGVTITQSTFSDVNSHLTTRVKFVGHVFKEGAYSDYEPVFPEIDGILMERPATIIIDDFQVRGHLVHQKYYNAVYPGDPIEAFARFIEPVNFIWEDQRITVIIDNKLSIIGKITIAKPPNEME